MSERLPHGDEPDLDPDIVVEPTPEPEPQEADERHRRPEESTGDAEAE